MPGQESQRTTAIGFARYAFEYIDAAILVEEARGEPQFVPQASYTPAYFLAVHGLELTLKAFLLHKGIEIDVLGSRQYGHDIKKCFAKADEMGIAHIFRKYDNDELALELLSELNHQHQLRYIQTGFKRFPLWSIVEPLIVRLYEAVSEEVGYRKKFDRMYVGYEK